MRENLYLEITWWQKIKAFFKRTQDGEGSLQLPQIIDLSTDPIRYIDELQNLVSKLRSEFDLTEGQSDLNVLAASTYLYHIDRILLKVRENMLTIHYRTEQLKEQPEQLNQIEFSQVQEAYSHCYIAIINLAALLKKVSIKEIYNDEVVNCIHALELESANLNTAIRALNQQSFRNETLLQLDALEQILKQTTMAPADTVYNDQGVMYSTTEYLQNQLKNVAVDDAKWLAVFVEVHDMLKKCYVVARKSVINTLLDKMCEHIQTLIAAFNRKNPDMDTIFYQLSLIFSNIESIRFNSNRESHCSKNLFEKAKLARLQLRKACQQHSVGREYLLRNAIKRDPLKIRMKRTYQR